MCSRSNGNESQHYELRPVLKEILRTCTYPGSIILRVEQIDRRDVKHDELNNVPSVKPERTDAQSVRLHLTDGQLLVQALLHRRLLNSMHARRLRVGDLIEIRVFSIKKASKKHGGGQIVYLSIKDCHFLNPHSPSSRSIDASRSDNFTLNIAQESNGTYLEENIRADIDIEDKQDVTRAFQSEHGPPVIGQASVPDVHLSTPRQISPKRWDKNLPLDADQSLDSNGTRKEMSMLPGSENAAEFEKLEIKEQPRPELGGETYSHFESSKRTSTKRKAQDESFDDVQDDPFQTISIDTVKAFQRRKSLLHKVNQPNRRKIHHTDTVADVSTSHSPQQPSHQSNNQDDKEIGGHQVISAIHEQFKSQNTHIPTQQQQQPPQSAQLEPMQASSISVLTPTPTPTPNQDNFISSNEPPLHNLASLINPPKGHSLPRKNYTINVLGVITHISTSLITRPGSSFPPKRHIKIDDPSLHTGKYQSPHTKGVTIAVYRDAANFKPAIGTIALFRGVVMQRLSNRDVILNVYAPAKARVKGTTDSNSRAGTESVDTTGVAQTDEWIVTSPAVLGRLGHDVKALENWWRSRQKERDRK